jgi:hypothetical protein
MEFDRTALARHRQIHPFLADPEGQQAEVPILDGCFVGLVDQPL